MLVAHSTTTRRSTAAGLYAAVALSATLVGLASTHPATARVAIGVVAAAALATLAERWPVVALQVLVLWLALLGAIRRMLTGLVSADALGDPLLLVGPPVLAVLALVAVEHGALQRRTVLTHAVLILGGSLVLSALNPAQGGLMVGAGGVLLVVVPMLAFLVGRVLLSDQVLSRVLWLFAVLAIPAAGYGLVQTFVGMPSWDQRWVEQRGYVALTVNGVTRAFSSFTSSAEYAIFLVIGVVCWLTLGTSSRWRPLVVPVAGLLAVAIWFESARSPVVLLVAALAAIAAARLRRSLATGLLFGGLAIVGIPLVAGLLAPTRFGAEPGDQLSAHQVHGLADPLGEGSTLPIHIELVVDGVMSIRDEPLGRGVGSVTLAATRFGGTLVSAEADPGNVARSAGFVGLVAYLVVLVLGIRIAYRRAIERHDGLGLAVLGGLFVTLLQWLNGGHYLVVILPWLLLGWLDRVAPPSTVASDE
jgi:hypothetical protein